jgi:hypothetical protein
MDVLESLKELSRELADLDLGSAIDTIQAPVDPLHFYREYVVRGWVGPAAPAALLQLVRPGRRLRLAPGCSPQLPRPSA